MPEEFENGGFRVADVGEGPPLPSPPPLILGKNENQRRKKPNKTTPALPP